MNRNDQVVRPEEVMARYAPTGSLQSGSTNRWEALMWYWTGGLLFFLYLALLISLGLTTIRKGHLFMFVLGFFLPIFWIVGALTPSARPIGA
jgi:hypothetical protein